MAEFDRASWYGLVPLASTSLILSALTVSAGRTIRGESVTTPKLVTAFVVILLIIMFANQLDPAFAATLAMLIFVAVFLEYGPDLFTYIGVNLEGE